MENSSENNKIQSNQTLVDLVFGSEQKQQNETNEEVLMKKYGITYSNEKYIFGTYRYDNLQDAISYAKLCEKRERT